METLRTLWPNVRLSFGLAKRRHRLYDLRRIGHQRRREPEPLDMVVILDHQPPPQALSVPDHPPTLVLDHHARPAGYPSHVTYVSGESRGLTGASLTWQFARALGAERGYVPDAQLAMLGHVADMGPQWGDGRILTAAGLAPRAKAERQPLFVVGARTLGMRVTPTQGDISFVLGPALNAVGRLDAGKADALLRDFLTLDRTGDEVGWATFFGGLAQLNEVRKELVSDLTEEALGVHSMRWVLPRPAPSEPLIWWRPDNHRIAWGLAGLMANRLADFHGRLSAVSLDPDAARWSIRVPEHRVAGFSALNVLDLLEARGLGEGGGHAAAAGFTFFPDVETELRSGTMESLLRTAMRGQPRTDPPAALPLHAADLSVMHEMRPEMKAELGALAPYGIGFPEPRFAVRSQLLDVDYHPNRLGRWDHANVHLTTPAPEGMPGGMEWRYPMTWYHHGFARDTLRQLIGRDAVFRLRPADGPRSRRFLIDGMSLTART